MFVPHTGAECCVLGAAGMGPTCPVTASDTQGSGEGSGLHSQAAWVSVQPYRFMLTALETVTTHICVTISIGNRVMTATHLLGLLEGLKELRHIKPLEGHKVSAQKTLASISKVC